MLSKQKEALLAILISMGSAAVGLFITPKSSLDPINVPKLFLLIPFSIAAFAFVLPNIKSLLGVNKVFLTLISLFILDLILVISFSGAPFIQQLNGTFGRNTGFLAYVSLALIALSSSLIPSRASIRKILYTLLGVGVLSLIYSTLQTTNNDPVKWRNPYNSILGFLGNPDFESSFLGFCAVVAVSFAFQPGIKIYLKTVAIIYSLYALFLMVRSHAQQGVLVTGIGIAFVIFAWIKGTPRFSSKIWLRSYLSLTAVVSVVVLFGTLKIGPLGETLYKISVRQRGYYWRAAVEMMKHHPLFGVGLDSYGDWYFRYRSADAALKSATVQSNASHNVFLDFGANGGLPLFLINLSLTLLAGFCAIRIIRRLKTFSWEITALIGAWLAYEAQALVSINQLGLAVWGWVFTGLLVGVEMGTRPAKIEEDLGPQTKKSTIKSKRRVKESLTSSFVATLCGLAFGLIIAIPGFQADGNFRKAQASGSASNLYSQVLKYPEDTQRTLQAAQLLANNNLRPQALELVNHVIKLNPNNYNFWQMKYELVDKNSVEASNIKTKLNELNPRVPLK